VIQRGNINITHFALLYVSLIYLHTYRFETGEHIASKNMFTGRCNGERVCFVFKRKINRSP
jgi:hypothetical protein